MNNIDCVATGLKIARSSVAKSFITIQEHIAENHTVALGDTALRCVANMAGVAHFESVTVHSPAAVNTHKSPACIFILWPIIIPRFRAV